jgi:hypothetical protein
MNQKVKLQINSDLLDVPRLSGVILQEAMIDVRILQGLVEQISSNLRNISLDSTEDLNILQKELDNMDGIRLLLTKIDSRVGDVASIISGLHEVLTKPRQEKEEQKVQKDDNISSG